MSANPQTEVVKESSMLMQKAMIAGNSDALTSTAEVHRPESIGAAGANKR